MAQLSSKLRSVKNPNGVTGIAHWCPGCNDIHEFAISGKNSSGAQWSWDGNAEAPTCNPSMNIRANTPDMKGYNSCAGSLVCHYFLKGGQIQFLGDSTHILKGQIVPLPDFPPEGIHRLKYGWFKDV